MTAKRLFFVFAAMLITAGLSQPPRVHPQQTPPCPSKQTNGQTNGQTSGQAAGKTVKQINLENCLCEQSTAPDNPSYRVGSAAFGRKVAPRVGNSARRSQQTKAQDLYDGLEMPDLKDLKSPEVVGLRQRISSAREVARQKVENLESKRKTLLQTRPNDWYTHKLNSPQARKRYEQFIALQTSEPLTNLPKFDWREQALDVGPVLNQGDCNSCWAFATLSVYQSSWLLEQLRLGDRYFEVTVPEYGSHRRFPSIQRLLNCIGKEKGDCHSGGWHGTAFAFMVNSFVPHIPDRLVWKYGDKQTAIEEYTGKKSSCTDPLLERRVKRGGKMAVPGEGGDGVDLPANSDQILTAWDRALAWGYVNEQKPDQLPTVAQFKQALIEHGPLAMPIKGDACFSVYQGGVFNGKKTGNPNHVMVLIGWDDEKQAWLIKNSWGEEWGEKGFGWVAYGSNSIGLYAAWIQPTPSTEKTYK